MPLAFVVLASCAAADTTDLPVATSGFEQWAGVVGKAMSFGDKNQEQSLQSLKTFQSKVMANMQKQVHLSAVHEVWFWKQSNIVREQGQQLLCALVSPASDQSSYAVRPLAQCAAQSTLV